MRYRHFTPRVLLRYAQGAHATAGMTENYTYSFTLITLLMNKH